MKLNSLARFRRRRRLIKILLLAFAVFTGFLLAAEGRYAVMRLGDISVTPPGALPQHVVWGVLTTRQELFWPSLLSSKKEYEEIIENYYPADVKLKLRGWGKFRLEVKPLAPAYKVFWGGKYWYLSEEGKLWSSSLKENAMLKEHDAEKKPVLTWGTDRATPVDMGDLKGNVLSSSIPIKLIKSWYVMADELGWGRNVKFIQAGVKEGTPIVRVIFYTAGNKNGAQLLLPNEAEKWPETGLAVKKLYGGIENLPPDIYIDGTYKGKILIRNLRDEQKEQEKKETPPDNKGAAKKNN
ncbi:MAG: hypothetical protein IJM42_07270 [Synergistes sp.]|nr:hypothetical protein [Synergistes sp.]MCR5336100.1 hypothetical protein [Synergistes sp.]